VGVLFTYPLGGIGGVLVGYGGVRLAIPNPRVEKRVPIEVLGGVGGFLAHTAGYVAVSAVEFAPVVANTVLPGVLVAVGATALVEAIAFAIKKLRA